MEKINIFAEKGDCSWKKISRSRKSEMCSWKKEDTSRKKISRSRKSEMCSRKKEDTSRKKVSCSRKNSNSSRKTKHSHGNLKSLIENATIQENSFCVKKLAIIYRKNYQPVPIPIPINITKDYRFQKAPTKL